MRLTTRWLIPLLFVMAILASPGCKTTGGKINSGPGTNPPVEEPAAQVATEPSAQEASEETLNGEAFGERELVAEDLGEEVATTADEIAEGMRVLDTVYFPLDSPELSAEALRTLEANARWLVLHPALRVVIEGHCDERGTTEYNMDLGAKRARSVRDHLARLGVLMDRVEVITYGEERPAELGHSEQAWSRNRRAEFVLETP